MDIQSRFVSIPPSKQRVIMLAVFVVVVLLVYSPIVFTRFGTADDYVFLYRFIAAPGFGDNPFTNGRPISFFLTYIAYSIAGSLSGLSAIRLAGLVLYGLLVWRFYSLTSSVRSLRPFGFWISLAIICLPSYQVVIPLAVDVSYPLAGILALAAVEIAGSVFSKRRPWILCFSVLSVMLAFMIYQPMTMLYWSGVLLILFRSRRSIGGKGSVNFCKMSWSRSVKACPSRTSCSDRSRSPSTQTQRW